MPRYNRHSEKLYESLPRQTTVDQLKRIRDEINKSQDIKVGPEHTYMSGDVGDRVIADLVSHKGKQEMNNLFWWDNPLDRHIDSYEQWVRTDNKDSLGYTKDGDPSTHKGTDIPNRPESDVPDQKRHMTGKNITGKNVLEKNNINEMENKPGKDVFDEKGIDKKLNNLLGFEDFEKSWKAKDQKSTKHTEVGLDIINEGLFDGIFLKSKLKKALDKCGEGSMVKDEYIYDVMTNFIEEYKRNKNSQLTWSLRKDLNTYLKNHLKADDYIIYVDKLKSYGFVNSPDSTPYTEPTRTETNRNSGRSSGLMKTSRYDKTYTPSTRIANEPRYSSTSPSPRIGRPIK